MLGMKYVNEFDVTLGMEYVTLGMEYLYEIVMK